MPSSMASRLILRTPVSLSRVPAFLYGTAWKKDQTQYLVDEAFTAGFDSIDTAAQPRHYNEKAVGLALQDALECRTYPREEMFIQTKYTPIGGQDPDTAPYNASDSIADQVRASVNSSFRNLFPRDGEGKGKEPYIDCVLLHSPLETIADTLTAWAALEEFYPHQVRNLGISNIDLQSLELIYDSVKVKPAVVQNRFYPETNFDRDIREFCVKNDMIYQAFWILTANPALLRSKEVRILSRILEISKEGALYCLMLSLPNVVVLDGTTDRDRMGEDVAAAYECWDWQDEEENKAAWEDVVASFRKLIGDKPM